MQITSIVFVDNYTRNISNHTFKTKDLATLFEFNECSVHKTLVRGAQHSDTLGHQAPLKPEAASSFVALVLEVFEAGKSMMYKEFLQMIYKGHDLQLTRSSVHAFLGRRLDELQLCCFLSEEETRLTVSRVHLKESINVLPVDLIQNVRGFIFNLDALGSVDWAECKVKKVISPSRVCKEDVFLPASRYQRYSTLPACISALDGRLTLLIRLASSIRDSLWSRRLRSDKVAMVCRHFPVCLDENVFYEYLSIVFIQHLMMARV